MTSKTVICNFYNESYFLWPWLHHHKKFFDHGIMIDHHSSDNSCELIKTVCPSWTIVSSRYPWLSARDTDAETEYYEQFVAGWRVCLNPSEFLHGNWHILNNRTDDWAWQVPGLVFVDPGNLLYTDGVEPCVYCTQGIDYQQHFAAKGARSIHNYKRTYDHIGRHFYNWNTEELVIFSYTYCPMNDAQFKRKLQFKDRIHPLDSQLGWGDHHRWSFEQIMTDWQQNKYPLSGDISHHVQRISTLEQAYLNQRDQQQLDPI